MKVAKKNNSYQSFDCMRAFQDSAEPEAMHPDDYSAHREWVTAKRSRDLCTGKLS
jgi:hypothetical protein